jgi:hypothetical protein
MLFGTFEIVFPKASVCRAARPRLDRHEVGDSKALRQRAYVRLERGREERRQQQLAVRRGIHQLPLDDATMVDKVVRSTTSTTSCKFKGEREWKEARAERLRRTCAVASVRSGSYSNNVRIISLRIVDVPILTIHRSP